MVFIRWYWGRVGWVICSLGAKFHSTSVDHTLEIAKFYLLRKVKRNKNEKRGLKEENEEIRCDTKSADCLLKSSPGDLREKESVVAKVFLVKLSKLRTVILEKLVVMFSSLNLL